MDVSGVSGFHTTLLPIDGGTSDSHPTYPVNEPLTETQLFRDLSVMKPTTITDKELSAWRDQDITFVDILVDVNGKANEVALGKIDQLEFKINSSRLPESEIRWQYAVDLYIATAEMNFDGIFVTNRELVANVLAFSRVVMPIYVLVAPLDEIEPTSVNARCTLHSRCPSSCIVRNVVRMMKHYAKRRIYQWQG